MTRKQARNEVRRDLGNAKRWKVRAVRRGGHCTLLLTRRSGDPALPGITQVVGVGKTWAAARRDSI